MNEHFFFKTPAPRQKTYLSTFGAWLDWEYINESAGLFVTRRIEVANELRSIERSRGSVIEISGEEYGELKKKQEKKRPLPVEWREELKKPSGLMHDSVMPPQKDPEKLSQSEADRRAAANVGRIRKNLEQSPLPEELRPRATQRT